MPTQLPVAAGALIDHAHQFVMGQWLLRRALVPGIEPQGISDLAVDGMKVSGNSVRCKRDHLLYHGTLLYDFPPRLVERCLKMPPRQPAYRRGRSHGVFLRNLPLTADAIRQATASAWQADEPRTDWPRQRTADLVAERYGRPEWNG